MDDWFLLVYIFTVYTRTKSLRFSPSFLSPVQDQKSWSLLKYICGLENE